MKSALACLLTLAVPMVVACTVSPASDDTDETTESALSSIKLEKSHVAVFLNQKNIVSSPGDCFIGSSLEATISTRFRIVYENPTLPAGTKVTVHLGEHFADQPWIGDGFGWGPYQERSWGKVRDLSMPGGSPVWKVETTADGYYEEPVYNMGPEEVQHPARIDFVFKLTLPSGQVIWDNRLGQDYSARGRGPSCSASTSGFEPLVSWGPF